MINDLELEEISSQLSLAEVNKNKLIKNIYKEYESYLKLVRELIFTSVEKTIYRFISDFSRNEESAFLSSRRKGTFIIDRYSFSISFA